MATWTDGVDRAAGYIVPAAVWNSQLGATGSLMYLKDKIITYQRDTVTSDQTITNSTSWTDITGLSISLTPTADDFILLFFQLPAYTYNGAYMSFQILKDATVIQSVIDYPMSTSSSHPITMIVLNIPGAGTFTYKVQAQNNQSPAVSTLYGAATTPIELTGILFGV